MSTVKKSHTSAENTGVERQRGFVLLSAAVLITVLALFFGFILDTGYLQTTRQRAQIAADAAAVAAAHAIRESSRPLEAAQRDATVNGFNPKDIVVQSPPLTGKFVGNTKAVEVSVSRRTPTFFMGLVNKGEVTVSARSVAIATESVRLVE